MTHPFSHRSALAVLAVGAAGALVATVPGVAVAAPTTTTTTTASSAATPTPTTPVSNPRCTPADFTAAQRLVESDLTGRVAQLTALSGAAGNTANRLSSGDRQTLSTDITTVELPGIQTLQTQVQSVTTCAGLRAVARAMVFDYRVYVVMTPQTHLTIVMDDESYIEGVFTNLEPQIATAVQNAQNAGKDVTAAQAAFIDLEHQVSTAQGATSGQAAQILAQTPAGYPGNWQVFLAARTNAANARADLHAAYADARRIRTDLQ